MGLSCRTFNGADPAGRQNVYLCCCGEDVRHSRKIMNDLFGCRNCRSCAVWYSSDPDEEMDLGELMNMQLVVLVVTNNLLNKYSDSFRSQLRFIREKNIPLLPVIIPGCDIGEYRFKFRDSGDTACLFSDSENYFVELDRRLKVLLGGVSLIKKIRDGYFTGSLYYAYCSRDAAKAHQLACTLHDMSGCRDIALITENMPLRDKTFGENSAVMMDKCSAMLVSLTPGVFYEDRDFVRDATVYADHMGIPIISVDMSDRRGPWMLRRWNKLPPGIKMDDLQKLYDAVQDAVGLQEDDDSPERKYYIGAAYLYGVDVEIDRDRALQLILSSANDGYLPAQQRLVQMYSYGIGVDIDVTAAAAWQKKAVRQIAAQYGSQPNDANAAGMLDSVNTLCEYYIRICSENDTVSLLGKVRRQLLEMDDFCCRHPHTQKNIRLMHEQSRCRDNLGRIYELLGDNDRAREMLLSAEQSYEDEMKLNMSAASLRSVASVRERLGSVCLAQGNDSEAESYYRGALGLREQAADSDAVNDRRDLAQCYHKLSELFGQRGDGTRCEECRLRELDILERLARTTDSVQSRSDLAKVLGTLCSDKSGQKNYLEAKKYGIRAVDILSRLSGELASMTIKRELIGGLETLGGIYDNLGLSINSETSFRKALEVRRDIAKDDPNDLELQDEFAAGCYNLAMMDQSQDDFRVLMRTAAKIWEKLYYSTKMNEFHEHALSARRALGHSDVGEAAVHIDTVKIYGRAKK